MTVKENLYAQRRGILGSLHNSVIRKTSEEYFSNSKHPLDI